MEEYNFIPETRVIHWFIRLQSWLIAKRDKRSLYKQFTSELHLDKLKKEEISYVLPKQYTIVTNEITKLFNVRDRMLLKIHHREYMPKQIAIDNQIKELEGEYDLLKNRRKDEKMELDRLRSKLKTTKQSEDLIALESRVSTADAKVKNTDAALKNIENQVSELIRTRKGNLENWKKQVKSVEKTIMMAIGKYIKGATKKIELAYGFTSFTYAIEKYDEELTKIVNGEY